MKSLHAWILLAMAGTLSLSLLLFIAISNHVQRVSLYPIFEAMDQLELESALDALHQGGPRAVSAYMQHLDELFGAHHYLLNAQGIDMVSGHDYVELLPKGPSVRMSRADWRGKLVITHESSDGRYWFVAVDARQTNRWTFFPYYLLVIGVTAIIYWLAAIGVLRPIQGIASALDHLGRGDLSVRLRMRRRDEIGGLANSFDGMAERIQTLLAGQRRLLTDISHELRSPLTRLKFAVRLAETNPLTEGTFERVRREVNRITLLVSEITELTRAEGDPLGRNPEDVKLQDVIEETVEDCRLEAECRGSSIAVHGLLSSTVQGDRELLRRAVENVLRNAIAYSPELGVIECGLKEDARSASISIRDYGPGVPERMLAQIFEPFFRVEEARDAESGGIGLGLSIAKRAVAVHCGEIAAENAHPGLRVRISIPLGQDRSTETDRSATPERPPQR